MRWPSPSVISTPRGLCAGSKRARGECIANRIEFLASMRTRIALVAILFSAAAFAQQVTTPAPSATPNQPSVWFNFQWNEGLPWQSYSIQVQADGKTHFNGTPNPSPDGDTDPVQQDFAMSEANRRKTFDLARKLNYFREDFDSHLKHIAQTGAKTLVYKSAQVQGSSTYNYSQNPDVQQLTQLFQGLAITLDFGRQLAWNYRFDKLGMNQTLHELEELQANHQVEELSAIEPILRKIANDPSLMNISRQSAQRLLKTIGVSGATSQSAAQP